MCKFSLYWIVFIFNLYYSIPAHASLITYEFAGVYSLSVIYNPSTTADAFVGEDFIGQFTYDDEQPLFSIITTDTRARYSTGEISAITGSYHFNAYHSPQLQIFNNWEFSPGGTAIDDFFLSVEQYDSSGTGFYLLQLILRDYTRTTLNTLSIPSTTEVEKLASGGHFYVRRFSSRGQEEWWAVGAFSTIKRVSIPEPPSQLLFFFFFILLTIRAMSLKTQDKHIKTELQTVG